MDYRFPKPFPAIVCAVLLVFGSGCSLFDSEDEFPKFFIAEVTFFEAPDSINYEDTLSIQIGGYLGPNLCYQLDRIELIRRTNMLDITVHALYDHGESGICLTAGSSFEEEILVAAPITISDQHDFTIAVHQPDGSTFEHTVNIVPNQN